MAFSPSSFEKFRASVRPVRRSAFGMVCGAALALVFSGCDRNIEPFEPGEEPSAPDLARIFPAETGAPAGGGATPRGAVPPARAEAGGGGAAPAASAPPAGSGVQPIAGTIDIAPASAGAAPPGGVLFVIARRQGAQGGPPMAVLRVADPTFPMDFEIGPQDVMIPSMQFVGPISLSARLDADGNAMTRGATDLSSQTLDALAPGAEGVALQLGGG